MSRGRKSAFAERLGWLPKDLRATLHEQPVIWLHAVSVGEVIAARPLLQGLRGRYPGHKLLLSVTTETGRGVAEHDQLADRVIYFPFDIGPAVRRVLDSVQPCVVIIMETEIWPLFTLEASQRGIPLLLANGRISDRSSTRYRRLAWFFRPVLAGFACLGMQTDLDRERIIAAGAPAERSQVLGNLKYDIPCGPVPVEQRLELRRQYAMAADNLVFTAASTHSGEEQAVLSAWRELAEQYPDARLVLVPRHPERSAEVARLVEQSGFKARRRTELAVDRLLAADELLLVDTVGELTNIYRLSDVVFVGGSLVPSGGHNLLEPAACGVPSLFGPHMNNFKEVAALTLQYGAGVQVADAAELQGALNDFLVSSELRQVIGANGLKMMRVAGGATQRYLDALDQVLSS
ncbi:MAG: 3-deoxy-D-manno-octulosonic acid transferase [Geobacter sp.]